MSRRSSSFRSLAAAATTAEPARTAVSMSYGPHFRGGRARDRRFYSDQVPVPTGGNYTEFVSGDSHFCAIRDVHRGFRPSYHGVPPPPPYSAGQQFREPGSQSAQPSPSTFQLQPVLPNRHARPVIAAFGNRQQFRPPQTSQPSRPRSSKPPDYREWERAKPGPPPQCERFTVLSYNILADYLATDHWQNLYSHIPQYMMDWNWRMRNILFELGLWSADILCFQEVDRFREIQAELNPRGYNGIWKLRTGNATDGCAIFWRASRFKLLHEESIQFNQLGLRDNVAQICVFESLNRQSNNYVASSPSTSSESSKRVIVCNIHVLFNPKRGDIKLGQIRVLLARAHSVSRLWDDAPVVICGDFNSTPKSPIYNFITKQKLDLSDISRDKVSGQASAEMHPSRLSYPYFRAQAADNLSEASETTFEKVAGNSVPKAALVQGSPISPATLPKVIQLESCEKVNYKALNSESVDRPSRPSKISKFIGTRHLGVSRQELASKKNAYCIDVSSLHIEVAVLVSASNGIHDKLPHDSSALYESAGFDLSMDEKSSLSDELVDDDSDDTQEDSNSFLADLHDAGQSSFASDLSPSSLNQESRSHCDEIFIERVPGDTGMTYSSSLRADWTPAEIEAATGNADCNIVEHPLKLISAYTEVEDSLGIRGSCGEPLITTYHRRFSGTVDYIWLSEGLQTAKILAPIPSHVMHQTRGFPTKKWGSDHIALVCELAFTTTVVSSQ